MKLPDALLEHWMRQAYHSAEFDIGSSGVANFSLRELRELIGLDWEQLDALVFRDSETLGDQQLRKVIADRYADGRVDNVMVTHGSTEANYLLHLALIRPGDEVVVLDPAYQQLASLAAGLGATVKKWQLHEADGFAPRLDELEKLLTPRTRLIIVNFPHNPTGTSMSREQYEQFLDMVQCVGAWLFWDAAFADLVYDTQPLPDPTSSYERAISMGTLSKAFGLPGLRVGWCIAPEEILAECVRLRDYISLHLSPLVEILARGVIEHADDIIHNRLGLAKQNLAVCERWAAENADHIGWYRPVGGVTAFPRLKTVANVDALCRRLAEQKVLTVPGSCFGQPQHIRLGFGGDRHGLEEGLRLLSAALHAD